MDRAKFVWKNWVKVLVRAAKLGLGAVQDGCGDDGWGVVVGTVAVMAGAGAEGVCWVGLAGWLREGQVGDGGDMVHEVVVGFAGQGEEWRISGGRRRRGRRWASVDGERAGHVVGAWG